MSRALAFIPARQGSKGVPNKNSRRLAGKPLIAFTLEAARAVKGLEIFVSTDDPKVLAIAEDFAIPTPYLRPVALATDTAPMTDVLLDGLRWLAARQTLPEITILLQPTSPFRTAHDIERTIDRMNQSDVEGVLGVSAMWTNPVECIRLNETGWDYLVPPSEGVTRRQDYASGFHFINGALYAFRTRAFLASGKIPVKRSQLLIMDDINTLDIDTERDFLMAETLMRERIGAQ